MWEVNSRMYVASVRFGCVLPFHTITADSVPHVLVCVNLNLGCLHSHMEATVIVIAASGILANSLIT